MKEFKKAQLRVGSAYKNQIRIPGVKNENRKHFSELYQQHDRSEGV